jgi:hypothetical protein
MPSEQVTVDTLIRIANHVRKGEIRTLRIKKRASGKNKGLLFADYTLQNATPADAELTAYRQRVAGVIEKAAQILANMELREFNIALKDPVDERYVYILEK